MQEDTRDKLLRAGEKLFAERGIAPVSMREINKAAGQRNTSAIHYHFGSKDALIEAIFERRMRDFNGRRKELLEEVKAKGQTQDLRAIVRASTLPLDEGLDGGEEHLNYILFFGHVLNESSRHVLAALTAPFSDGMRETNRMIRPLLGDLPDEVVKERMALALEMIVFTLGQRARMLKSGGARPLRFSNEVFLSNLVDFICGGLTAPVSPGSAPDGPPRTKAPGPRAGRSRRKTGA